MSTVWLPVSLGGSIGTIEPAIGPLVLNQFTPKDTFQGSEQNL